MLCVALVWFVSLHAVLRSLWFSLTFIYMIIIKQDCVRTSFILKHYVPFPILWVNLFSYNNLSNFFPVKEMPINKQSCLYVYWSIIWWDKIVNFIISICYISNSLVIKICAMSRNLGSKKVNNSITVHNKQEHIAHHCHEWRN